MTHDERQIILSVRTALMAESATDRARAMHAARYYAARTLGFSFTAFAQEKDGTFSGGQMYREGPEMPVSDVSGPTVKPTRCDVCARNLPSPEGRSK